jgi:serine/threonine-protein kinase
MFDYFNFLGSFNPLNRYQLHESLGSGTYGNVHRAIDSRTTHTVALKRPSQTNGDIFRRFCNEVKFYQLMNNSPYILKMLDYNLSPFSPFLVTEYCSLGSVRSKLWELRFNRLRTIALIWQAASALADVHSRGLLHRDFKPDNLLLMTDSQNNWILKLGDPGLACFPVTSAFDFGATRTIRGTEFYIAPELYKPNASYTAAADAFSFGVTAIEMLSGGGKRPIAGTKVLDYSENLNNLLTQMISVNPQERLDMISVVKTLVGIYKEEIQKEQNLKLGVGLGILAIFGIGGYFLLKEDS